MMTSARSFHFPANVPTREHDFFLISSRFHVENDVILRTFWLKQIPLYPFLQEKLSVVIDGHFFFSQSFKEDNQAVFLLGEKRFLSRADMNSDFNESES